MSEYADTFDRNVHFLHFVDYIESVEENLMCETYPWADWEQARSNLAGCLAYRPDRVDYQTTNRRPVFAGAGTDWKFIYQHYALSYVLIVWIALWFT